ncbi:GDP-mannose 4,6-dehydratase [Labrys portucalensis]|uniref:GDP-mannose 4,6-dehydratase n=1 Tax=Labrys neptuniae TaxID=376174 RepID=A0ABV6ZID1_9HYPH
MNGKTALITGMTGQDGYYLTRLLLGKGYQVHGIKRPSSSFNTARLDAIYQDPHVEGRRLHIHYADMQDGQSLVRVIDAVQPDEIYNLAAQSHVRVSFDMPEYTADIDAIGALRLLQAIRTLKLEGRCRFYQASTSELYGGQSDRPQDESSPFNPRSPYAIAKLYAHWTTVNHREAYGLHASNGILFNHESPVRGETFVSRKITRAVAAIEAGRQDRLYLGNLGARRDWGHARDYVEGMWRMLQQDQPGDYVLATGRVHSVRDFVERAFAHVGRSLDWVGEGIAERGLDRASGRELVAIDPRYFRPTEVDCLIGNAAKAHAVLGWRHHTTFEALVTEMMTADIETERGNKLDEGGGRES